MATILEIARLANVSCSTVSRALNGRKGVSEKVREKIIQLSRDLNYYPHFTAQALVSKRLGVLGVIIPRTSEYTFTSPYYSHILLGISTAATPKRYQLMLVINEQDSYAAFFHRRQVDGILLVGNDYDDPKIGELSEANVPSVAVPGFITSHPQGPISINSDNYAPNYQAVRHLIELGHRRIAYVLGKPKSRYTVERLEAYKNALADQGLPFREEYVAATDFSVADGYRLAGKLLDLDRPPTSIIFINDSTSIGGLDQIKARKLRIPEDLSVVVTCASDILSHVDPPLTSVEVPVVSVGKSATETLIQWIETGAPPPQPPAFPARFVVRRSTGPCPS